MDYLQNCPIKIGSKVYYCIEGDNCLGCELDYEATVEIGIVIQLTFISNDSFNFIIDSHNDSGEHTEITNEALGKTVFLNKKDAENALY